MKLNYILFLIHGGINPIAMFVHILLAMVVSISGVVFIEMLLENKSPAELGIDILYVGVAIASVAIGLGIFIRLGMHKKEEEEREKE